MAPLRETGARGLIARQSVLFIFRERTVVLLAGLFVVLVMISAYLGWSATTTVNSIYDKAVVYLQNANQPIPPNPVLEISPLSLLRNMSIYVSLIGALAAIVVGYQLIASDRKSGVVPLIGVRPLKAGAYAAGKISALVGVVLALMAVAALISIATFMILPNVQLSGAGWGQLFGFFALSVVYMLIFGLLAMATAATARSESVGLLFPVTVWLTLTFILPSITANIHPTAAINPVSALALAPDSTFFNWSGQIVGSVSLAESFKFLASGLLDFLPPGTTSPAWIPPLPQLLMALVVGLLMAFRAVSRMDMAQGDYHV